MAERLRSSYLAALAISMATVHASEALAQLADVGLSTVRAQRFGRSSNPIPNANGSDLFAYALAAGDFNGDGAEDLAVGSPGSRGGTAPQVSACGAVFVRYGVHGAGLAGGGAPTVLGQFIAGSPTPAEFGDMFGLALVACNLNGDAFDDLVVGVPFETVTLPINLDFPQAGMIEVFNGTANGLVAPATTSRREVAEFNLPVAHARFGWSVACGDFDADGFDDLAVGLPYRDLGTGREAAGRINVYTGSPSGISLAALALDQDSAGMDGTAAALDVFGSALAAGDFNGDGFADLAIGVPNETIPSGPNAGVRAGAVQIVYGSDNGLASGVDLLLPESAVAPVSGIDYFGWALAVGNFDADAYDDLAIGAPGFDIGGNIGVGLFAELFGSASGLGPLGSQLFHADAILGAGGSSPADLLGRALAAGDFDGDGADDLAAGIPNDDVGGSNDGAVLIVKGQVGIGLAPAPNRHRHISHGIEGFPGDASEDLLQFGDALAAGDFDGDGVADLAIGAPVEREELLNNVGTITVIYGALFADGFEASTGLWSATVSP